MIQLITKTLFFGFLSTFAYIFIQYVGGIFKIKDLNINNIISKIKGKYKNVDI